MDEEAPRLVYNPDDGSVELRLGARTVTVDGIDAEVVFERMTPDGEAAAPLWLTPAEADVLRKMIGYILEKVRITESSKETLAALLPRVQAIAEASADGGAGDDGAGGGVAGRGRAPGGRRESSSSRDSGGGRISGGGRDSDGGRISGGGRDSDGGRSSGGGRDSGGAAGDQADGGHGGGGPIDVPGVRRGLARPDDDDDGG